VHIAYNSYGGVSASDIIYIIDTVTKTRRVTKATGVPCAFSPDGKSLAMGADNGWIQLFEAEKGQSKVLFEGFTDAILELPNEYLIIDYKTNKSPDKDNGHMKQLEIYKGCSLFPII
jgi:WD40 repeat protein